ncbi:MAG: nucleotide-binding protein [Nitrososphaerota archaeon]|nr:nucleotide-binding protein [Candidatus Bathyarchaeota archaeon]MDW8048147.1 nucleotide-binding protein [Nitrososphaerota archaeon]
MIGCNGEDKGLPKVIFDSNFLFVPFQFHIDIFDEIEALLGRFEPLILRPALMEIEKLARKGSTKKQKAALAALDVARRCRIIDVECEQVKSIDDLIVLAAQRLVCIVATNDAGLRRKLREIGVPTIFVRKRQHLEIDGYALK